MAYKITQEIENPLRVPPSDEYNQLQQVIYTLTCIPGKYLDKFFPNSWSLSFRQSKTRATQKDPYLENLKLKLQTGRRKV
jgi:hypothetical protein